MGDSGRSKKWLDGGRAHEMEKEEQKKNLENLGSFLGGKREGKIQDERQVSGMSE